MNLRLVNFQAAAVLLLTTSTCCSQSILFRDDFDGSLSDRWFIPERYSGFQSEVVDGQWLWTPESTLMKAFVSGMPDDVSIRARVRLRQRPVSEVFLPLQGRGVADPNVGNYYGGITSANRVAGGIAYRQILQIQTEPLDPSTHDIDMRLDIEGNEFRFWAWESDTEMPTQPLFTVANSAIASGDHVSITYNTRGLNSAPVVAWDFVEIRSIPEPSGESMVFVAMAVIASVGRKRRRRTKFKEPAIK